jgi:hypothetical protein
MKRTLFSIIVAAALAIAFGPVASASDAGHEYEFEDSITADVPGAYATSNAHDYEISAVTPGTTIEADLSWDNPNADMNVFVSSPSGTCSIAPDPEPTCLANLAAANAQAADCGGPSGADLPDSTEDSASADADKAGTWTVTAAANLLAPTQSVNYDLSFTVSDAHGSVVGPDATNYVHSTGHCALVE